MKKIGKNAKLYIIGMIIGGITLGLTTVVADTIINSTNVSYKTGTVKAALDNLYGLTADDVWQKIYPVGSIYISVSSTNPSTLFGGTWVAFGQGRTLVGVGPIEVNTTTNHGTVTPGEINSQVSETRGGEAKHTLTVSEMPSHFHASRAFICGYSGWSNLHIGSMYALDYTHMYNSNLADYTGKCSQTNLIDADRSHYVGGSTSHNVVQPYITVYMWKRTA